MTEVNKFKMYLYKKNLCKIQFHDVFNLGNSYTFKTNYTFSQDK